MIRIAHLSDLHYCPKHLDQVHKATMHAISAAVAQRCHVAVISGDLTDHRVDFHSPSAQCLMQAVHALAYHMPVLVLQGTFSHDPPGSVKQLSRVRSRFQIHASTEIESVGLDTGDRWVKPADASDDVRAIFRCLPTVAKQKVAAKYGAEDVNERTGELIADVLAGWHEPNIRAAEAGIPTIGVAHGTVNGCETESGVPMAGLDHEFSPAALFSSGCDAFLLGHIHKHQAWVADSGQVAAYAGSIAKLHFGERYDKGWLEWDVAPRSVDFALYQVPTVDLLRLDYEGPPDLGDLEITVAEYPGDPANTRVRLRYKVDEEHRHTVNHEAIERLFEQANFKELSIQPTINPLHRQRAAGISSKQTIGDKVRVYAEHVEMPASDLSALLEMVEALQQAEPGRIAERTLEVLHGEDFDCRDYPR